MITLLIDSAFFTPFCLLSWLSVAFGHSGYLHCFRLFTVAHLTWVSVVGFFLVLVVLNMDVLLLLRITLLDDWFPNGFLALNFD